MMAATAPSTRNVTVPVALVGAGEAMTSAGAPTLTGPAGPSSVVVVAIGFTVCASGADVEAKCVSLPLYDATIETPAETANVVVQVAAPAAIGWALQPVMDVPLAVNATVPVALAGVTVAVNVTA